MDPERLVLFVCVGNAGRSLMAEAMFNADPAPGWRAISAGTDPARAPNPRTGPMLREIGLEPPAHPPQPLTQAMMDQARTVITMGCLDSESCPARLKTMEVTDWALPDPAHLDDDGFRRVRDDIRTRVSGLRLSLVVTDRSRARIASRP
jgi:arsenate reductase